MGNKFRLLKVNRSCIIIIMIKYAALAFLIICSIDSSLVYAVNTSQNSGMSIHEAKNTGAADTNLDHKKQELKNPEPFRALSHLVENLTEAEKKEDQKKAYHDGRIETYLPVEIASLCAEYLDPATACTAVSIKNIPKGKLFLNELNRQFVKIPEGFLPPEDSRERKDSSKCL